MLESVRVVEFGEYIAAPQAGAFLADFGADVVKIERPGGDPARVYRSFEVWNRNKRTIELDLRTDVGQSEAQRLLAAADIVLEGLGPDVLRRAGLEAETSLTRYPSLVWCRIPAYAAGLDLQCLAGWEPIIAAQTGLFGGSHMTRRSNDWKQGADDQPVFAPLPFASTFAAIDATNAALAGLRARRVSGAGQVIDVPIHSALTTLAGFIQLRLNRESLSEGGARWSSPIHAPYLCSDGRWFFIHVATERMFNDFIRILELDAWVAEGILVRSRLATMREAAEAVRCRLEALFAERPAVEWETLLSDGGISCCVARSTEEWANHPSARAAGLTLEAQGGARVRVQPGSPARAIGRPYAVPLPPLSVAAAAVQWQQRDVAAPLTVPDMANGPLSGVRVVDLTHYIAGPTCGRTLAEMGADVIKIDSPGTPYFDRFWRDVSRGKRSLVIDLKSPAGKRAMMKLIEGADVVVENFRTGVAERLGIGFDDVRQLNPRAVYASLNCYGYAGEFAGRPGWEQLGQAVSGMMIHAGGRDAPPQLGAFAVNDYGTGLTLALGVLAALIERDAVGRGLRVTAALAGTAEILQVPYLAGDLDGSLDGREVLGYSAWSRLYHCSDAWIYLHVPMHQRQALRDLPAFAELWRDPRAVESQAWDSWIAEAMAACVRTRPAADWLVEFVRARLAATRVLSIDEVNADAAMRAAGLTVERPGYAGETIEHVGVPYRFYGTPAREPREAPPVGSDMDEVLREIGLSDEEIREIASSGAMPVAP